MSNLTTNSAKITITVGTQAMEVDLLEATSVAAILQSKNINFQGAIVTLKAAGGTTRVVAPEAVETTSVAPGSLLSVNTKTDNGATTIRALVGTNYVTVVLEEGANLGAVLAALGLDGKELTITLNGRAVPQAAVANHTVQANDRLTLNTRVSNG